MPRLKILIENMLLKYGFYGLTLSNKSPDTRLFLVKESSGVRLFLLTAHIVNLEESKQFSCF